MKEKLIMILLFVFIITASYLLSDSIIKSVNTEENKYKKYLGEKYIIDNDTLIIVDYSIFSENFTLSDGRKVNYILIHKN